MTTLLTPLDFTLTTASPEFEFSINESGGNYCEYAANDFAPVPWSAGATVKISRKFSDFVGEVPQLVSPTGSTQFGFSYPAGGIGFGSLAKTGTIKFTLTGGDVNTLVKVSVR